MCKTITGACISMFIIIIIIIEEGVNWGETALGGAEFVVLQELSANLRCCVATAGGGVGAAARGDCWPALFGAVTIWLGVCAFLLRVPVPK